MSIQLTNTFDASINKFKTVLDIINLKNIQNKEVVQNLLIFETSTYNIIESNSWVSLKWDGVYGLVNKFLTHLNDEESTTLAYVFAHIHQEYIKFIDNDDIKQLSKHLKTQAEEIIKLNNSIGLCDKLRNFAETIPIRVDPKLGTRPHDDPKLTFYKEELIDMISIVLLSKLLSPLFGVIMSSLKGPLRSKEKEIHCASLINKLLTIQYPKLMDKFHYYIENQINKNFKSNMSNTMNMWTKDRLEYHIWASLLTRSYVNINLLDKDSNIMKYTMVICKKIIDCTNRESQNKPYQERYGHFANSDDEENVGQLELDSLVSKKTYDTSQLIKCTIDKTITTYQLRYDLNNGLYQEICNYYNYGNLIQTPFNILVTSTIFGNDFSGGKSILMLHKPEYTKILSLLVVLSYQLGYLKLCAMLSALPSDTGKIDLSITDNIVVSQYVNDSKYIELRNLYNPENVKEWDDYFEKVFADIVNKNYLFNLPIHIWDALNSEVLNNKIIKPDIELVTQTCEFIKLLVEKDV